MAGSQGRRAKEKESPVRVLRELNGNGLDKSPRIARPRKAAKSVSGLTLRDRLSRLKYAEAVSLLGSSGAKLISTGSRHEVDLHRDIRLGGDRFELTFPAPVAGKPKAIVTISLAPPPLSTLQSHCTACEGACEHVGAALSVVLEEKTALGLAAAPRDLDRSRPATEQELIDRALTERQQRADMEKMKVVSSDSSVPWTDYTVSSALSQKTYRVALRGVDRGVSYCSCPDFRTNTLGTCKHVLHVLGKVQRKFSASELRRPFRRKTISIAVSYGQDVQLRMLLPEKLDDETNAIVGKLRDLPIDDPHDLLKRIRHLERIGRDVQIYPDAEEFIRQRLFQDQISDRVAEIRCKPDAHPLRDSLLKTKLLPYQLDGIAFAAGAGRAILADEMGLGKTIQGIGVAELLAREAAISKVLVVCPTSLKSQWKSEIERFSDRTVQLVSGASHERSSQYSGESFFTVCNYEQVMRDLASVERTGWDLIVLDEGQRIKNWEAKTSRVIKGLRSRFALVLSGTPLENRLDELYSVVQFIDDRRLGPGFRFFHTHRVVDEKGKVLGFKNLAELRENLKPILLRRTRASVQQQLPTRTNQIVRIPPTQEQAAMSMEHLQNVSRIVNKPYLTEMDLLLMQKELLLSRMAANSTYLVDKQKPGHSSKLERLDELLEQLFVEDDRKVILFSEWTTMLDLIEPLLKKRKLDFVRLDGSVPQKQRQALIQRFQTDSTCRLFITTNAGSTGLNLQSANTVINVDLPWNPAVLEQRVARAYRMGQKQPVNVYILVTEQTLEEKLLATLAAKQDLALAALDPDSEVDEVRMESGMEELKRRLEVLMGAQPEAAPIASVPTPQPSVERDERQARMATAGGALLASAVNFLNELIPARPESEATRQVAASLKQGLAECVQKDERGQARLTFTLPDPSILDKLAESISRLLVR